MEEERFAWFVGIDWGSERHHACLVDSDGTIIAEREFSHSGTGLAELADWPIQITGAASEVVVAIEVPHGPVVDTLLDRGFAVYSINPKVLDRLRDRFSVAGAKDDQRDAYVLADGVRTDWRLFRRIQVSDPRLIELRAWSRLAEELQEERVRLSKRNASSALAVLPLAMFRDPSTPSEIRVAVVSPRPRHQFIDALLRPAVHQARDEIGEIDLRIDAIQLTGLDQRRQTSPILPAFVAAGKKAIFPR